jgi:dienelactone hydrolase
MIHMEKLRIHDIPLYQVQASRSPERCPVVIALHGFGENKESLLPYAEHLARQGITLLIPDAPRHGERATGEDRMALASVHKITPILLGLLRDVTTLVRHVQTSEVFDGKRIGLTGVSMGGVVTLAAMTRHPEIKTGVALLAIDSARKFARHHQFSRIIWPVFSYLDRYIDSKRIPPRPLLLLNGANDPVMPVQCIREFVQETKHLYRENGKIELVEFPGVGHEVVPEMVARTQDWFASHL